jgi:hypothetical protein
MAVRQAMDFSPNRQWLIQFGAAYNERIDEFLKVRKASEAGTLDRLDKMNGRGDRDRSEAVRGGLNHGAA